MYAVRRGLFLAKPSASLAQKPLLSFAPQRKFLKLVNLGDGTAQRGRFTTAGKWAMVETSIDDRFIAMYQSPATDAIEHQTVVRPTHLDAQCRGCGCTDSESQQGIERTTEWRDFQDSCPFTTMVKGADCFGRFLHGALPRPLSLGQDCGSTCIMVVSYPIAALSTLVLADGLNYVSKNNSRDHRRTQS